MPFGPNITISLHPLINDFFHWNVVCKGQKSNNIIIHMPWKILKKIFHFIINHEKTGLFHVFFLSFFPNHHHHTQTTLFWNKHKFTLQITFQKISKSFFYYCLYFPALHTGALLFLNHTYPTFPKHTKTRTRFAPTCRYTSVSWGMRTILDHFGWSTMLNLWKGATYPAAGPENMSQIMRQGRVLVKINS